MNYRVVFKLLQANLFLWRFDIMYKRTMNVAKGIGMGVLAGMTVAAISTKALSGGNKKATHMKKSAGKAMHTVGNLIGDVEKMLR